MSNAVEKMEEPKRRSDVMVSMVERVLMDPNVPVERFERILELQNAERTRVAKLAYSAAMSAAQSEMRVVVADKNNSQTKSKYASYAALDSAVRPIYTKHGFSVTFDTDDVPGKAEYIRILADVSSNGYERRYHLDMPADGKGAKGGDVMTKTHAVMSAASYGKRGLLILIFNIPVADRWDDDGNAAGGALPVEEKPTINEAQVKQIKDALAFRDVPEERALKRFKVESFEEIYAVDFEACLKIAQAAGARE